MIFIPDFFTLHTYTLFTDAATVFVIFKWMNPSIYRLKYCKACTIHVLLIECLVRGETPGVNSRGVMCAGHMCGCV